MNNKIIERTPDGGFFMYDHNQRHEVWRARLAQGLPVTQQKYITDSPLLGRKVLCKDNNKVYTIVKVIHEWYAGWYVKVVMNDEIQSSHVPSWENISCFDPLILSLIEDTKKSYELIDSI